MYQQNQQVIYEPNMNASVADQAYPSAVPQDMATGEKT
jgi:hypothetical protein